MPQKRLFRLFLCLVLLTPLAFGNSFPAPTEKSAHVGACNLPGPSNLHVVSVGSNTATIAWDAVSGAWGYKVYLSNNGNPPSASGITTATSMTFFNLGPGTYTATVHSMCSLVDESPQSSAVQFSTIIIEIVCEATGGSSQYNSITGSNNLFDYQWLAAGMETYCFYVQYGNALAKFKFYRSTNGNSSFTIRPLTGNPTGFYLGRKNSEGTSSFCDGSSGAGLTGEFYVKHGSSTVATGYFQRDNLLKFDMTLGYNVSVWRDGGTPPPLPPYAPGETGWSDDPATALPTPQPNPFSDELFLTGGDTDTPVQGMLLDARGLVMQLNFNASDLSNGVMAIPTGELPSGVYFLQLRSSKGSTTHKLLKL